MLAQISGYHQLWDTFVLEDHHERFRAPMYAEGPLAYQKDLG